MAAPTLPDGHPPFHDTDAGGNCRFPGCRFNSDIDHYERIERGEPVYGPDAAAPSTPDDED